MNTLLKPHEAAEMLTVSERTLAEWRRRCVGPAWVNVAPAGSERAIPRYRVEDLDAYIARREEGVAS
jgi:hypothetical protein